MSREIKFRAVIPERNATVIFDFIDLIKPKTLFSYRELVIPWLLAGNIPDRYTGLKDKKGTKIFEGDIVKHSDIKEPIFVGWATPQAGFCLNKKDWMYAHYFAEAIEPQDVEVIGNIHSNPELMEVDK